MENTPDSSPARTRKARPKVTPESKSGKSKATKSSAVNTAAKSTTPAKATSGKPATAPRVKKASAKKPASSAVIAHSEAEIRKMIAEAAYFLAEHRDFVSGLEMHDWLTAEQFIRQQFQHA